MSFLDPLRDYIYALTRIVFGGLFAFHGAQKLFGMFGGIPAEHLNALTYTAGTIELVGGLLVAVGFQTRVAAFLCSGLMAVAYFMAHQTRGVWPIENGGELAVLYCWAFLLIAAYGSGIWSLSPARE